MNEQTDNYLNKYRFSFGTYFAVTSEAGIDVQSNNIKAIFRPLVSYWICAHQKQYIWTISETSSMFVYCKLCIEQPRKRGALVPQISSDL